MDKDKKARLNWVKLYQTTNNAGYVCRPCGISRPTLRKWVKRYQEEGLQGVVNRSKRTRNSPNQKIDQQVTEWVLSLRKNPNLGARRIQPELFRQHEYSLSLATIKKILVKHQPPPIKELRRHKKFNRYQRPMPGDRIFLGTEIICLPSLH